MKTFFKYWWLWLILLALLLTIIFWNPITKAAKQAANYVLNKQQQPYIDKLNASVRQNFAAFIDEVQKTTNWTIYITSGYRTFLDQYNLWKAGKTSTKAGFSLHNYGAAIDINAFSGTTWLKMGSSKQAWLDSGIPQIAAKHGLGWGGYYEKADNVHFYKTGLNSTQLLAIAEQKFGTDPANIKGNLVNLAA